MKFVPQPGSPQPDRIGQLTVAVGHTTRRTTFMLGEHTFSTAEARIRFRRIRDVDRDGRVGFDDVATGARLRLRGRVIEPRPRCSAPTTVLLRRILVRR